MNMKHKLSKHLQMLFFVVLVWGCQ